MDEISTLVFIVSPKATIASGEMLVRMRRRLSSLAMLRKTLSRYSVELDWRFNAILRMAGVSG